MNSQDYLSLAQRVGWAPRPAAIAQHAAPQPAPQLIPRPSVREVLSDWGPWACCVGLLGVCDDGIPLAAHFFDPQRTSHYVFYGQDDAILATLVEPLLYSMGAQSYGQEHWQFVILSEKTTEWQVASSAHCQGIISPYEREGDEVIPAMAGLMEQRGFGRQRGPRQIVVLHDLGRYWRQLSDDSRRDIMPLLKHGHEFGIHVLVTLRYAHHAVIPRPLRRLLRHKIYGYASTVHLPNTATFRDLGDLLQHDLQPYQAWVRADGEWMRYIAPRLG